MLNGNGGWPLSIIMTPDKKPFFAGTYFPNESGYGRIGFKDLIRNVNSAWKEKRNEITESVNHISFSLSHVQSKTEKVQIDGKHLETAFKYFANRYDPVNGGFGSAPKFPSPHNLLFLLRYWKRTNNDAALSMVVRTLTEMRKGGIFDHIGFGFHRYSTDEHWLVPHFEKMLYDQALLIIAYTEAYQATQNIDFKHTAEEIIEYVLRDMTSPLGGFFSAEDSDSEGQEGKFYVWSKTELIECLGEDDAEFAFLVFCVSEHGNFKDESSGQIDGSNILHLSKSYAEMAILFGLTEDDFRMKLEAIRSKLFTSRKKRVHPFKDDKILLDWNSLMIAAFSIAGRAFSNARYILAAENSYNFIKKYLPDGDGKLLHRYRDGEAGFIANLDDYSFLILGLTELYQSTFKKSYIEDAILFTDFSIKHFWDDRNGGFFFTPDYGETLIIRTKDIYDGAIPSGNSVMTLNLIRLYHITGYSKYDDYVKNQIDAFSEHISKSPHASSFTLCALEYLFGTPSEIVVVNYRMNDEVRTLLNRLNNRFLPNKVLVFLSESESDKQLSFEYLKTHRAIDNKPTIYLCRDFSCAMPTNDLKAVLAQL
jgi:hypothetical protein